MKKFNPGDKVNVLYCEELEMPCMVEGPDPWCAEIVKEDGSKIHLYKVIGKHAKKGNLTAVRVSCSQLSLWEG